MKKIILIAAMAVAAIGASAQDWNKGDWFVGAQTTGLGLNYGFLDKASQTDFNLSVNGGYVFANKFAADATLGFDTWSVKDGVSSSTFTYGIGVRYYPVGNWFARVGFDGAAIKDADENPMYAGLTLGYDWFVSEKVFFEPAIYYKKGLNDKIDETNNLGLQLGIGVRF